MFTLVNQLRLYQSWSHIALRSITTDVVSSLQPPGEKKHMNVRAQHFGPIPVRDSFNHDAVIKGSFDFVKRSSLFYNGVPFDQLTIARISARWNNTIITMRDNSNKFFCKVSCRDAGFFNAKKKSELAGETTGKVAGQKALERGCTEHVRVVLKGIGPGRKSSIDGLVQAGLKVVSISDITPITNVKLSRRPRKIRRI